MKFILVNDQLIEHMKKKGITFEIVSEAAAADFLKHNNYFMKLAAYRKNYKKNSEGKYIGLDFAYLQELSRVDAKLRYIIFHMAADIEHFLKVKLLREIEKKPGEDGYELVKRFLAKDIKFANLKKIKGHKVSLYCQGLIDKYYPYFPIWAFVEVISFGQLAHLCNYYKEIYGTAIADNILLNSVRDIRNACAHSNCLVYNLVSKDNRPHQSVKNRVKKIKGFGKGIIDKKLRNKFIYDFVCLLYAYDEIVPDCTSKDHRYEELDHLFNDRMKKHEEWFRKNNIIASTYIFLKKIMLTII